MMDKIFGTYREEFPIDRDGKRVKLNVFMSYPHHKNIKGKSVKV